MVVIGLLDLGADLASPNHQHTIVLTGGTEDYEPVESATSRLRAQLQRLADEGLDGKPVKMFFSADWKFTNTLLGMKGRFFYTGSG